LVRTCEQKVNREEKLTHRFSAQLADSPPANCE
jgi:hypothetical protein